MSWEDKTKTWIKGLFGESNDKKVKSLQVYVDRANTFEKAFEQLSDEQLQAKTAEFRQTIENALKDVPDRDLLPADASKMPGQIRTEKDRVLGDAT
jgi:preprotein translocase subunit SecA